MTAKLALLCRVIARRLASGETWEAALAAYPKLTEQEIALLRSALQR